MSVAGDQSDEPLGRKVFPNLSYQRALSVFYTIQLGFTENSFMTATEGTHEIRDEHSVIETETEVSVARANHSIGSLQLPVMKTLILAVILVLDLMDEFWEHLQEGTN